MAATASEQPNARQISGTSGHIGYLVTGAATEAEARAAILDAAPATFGGLYLRDAAATVSEDAAGLWAGEATYGTPGGAKALAAGEVAISGTPGGDFQVRRCATTLSGDLVLACLLATGFGRTTHMTHGFELLGSYAPSAKTAPNFGGAINVTSAGVEGTDVPPGALNDAAATFTVNGLVLGAFDEGECLFRGLSFQNRADGLWELAWDFSAMASWTDLVIDTIEGIAMPAWSYLWTLYEEIEDGTAKTLVRRAKAVYVHRVYDAVDFTALGTGVIT
jgi:hypothetical protein